MKIFREIRQAFILEGKLKKYLIYALGEIILVMVGILLALQVNNWKTERTNKNAERTSYQNIKRQINDDLIVISKAIDYNNHYLEQYKYAAQIIEKNDRKNADTLGYIALKLVKYSDFNRNSNIYQTIVNSGEIKLLKNKAILEGLQRLEETYIYMNRMEKTHFDAILSGVVSDLQANLKFSDRSIQKPNSLFTYEFQNHFLIFIRIMLEKDDIYRKAIAEINAITQLIDKELNRE